MRLCPISELDSFEVLLVHVLVHSNGTKMGDRAISAIAHTFPNFRKSTPTTQNSVLTALGKMLLHCSEIYACISWKNVFKLKNTFALLGKIRLHLLEKGAQTVLKNVLALPLK